MMWLRVTRTTQSPVSRLSVDRCVPRTSGDAIAGRVGVGVGVFFFARVQCTNQRNVERSKQVLMLWFVFNHSFFSFIVAFPILMAVMAANLMAKSVNFNGH